MDWVVKRLSQVCIVTVKGNWDKPIRHGTAWFFFERPGKGFQEVGGLSLGGFLGEIP